MTLQTVNPKTGIDLLPDLNKPKAKSMPETCEENLLPNGQLRTQFGGRIRLSDDDRDKLRAAYNKARNSEIPDETTPSGASPIRTVTRWTTPKLNRALGMDDVLFTQLISGRDPIQLGIILKIQNVLNVKIVTDAYLKKVFNSYLAHIKKHAQEPGM